MIQRQITQIGLIRHAPTVWNVEKRIQGHQNSPLTPRGRELSLKWGAVLKKGGWQQILSSDLGRALETVAGINQSLNLPLECDIRLREQDWGAWSGEKLEGICRRLGREKEQTEQAGWHFRPPNGESRQEIWQRSRKALLEAACRWPGRKILVVTHDGVIKAVLYYLLGRQFLSHEPVLIKPYHVHMLALEGHELCIKSVNKQALGF